MTEAIDLGWPVARFDTSRKQIEFFTPADGGDGSFHVLPQYILIYRKENIDRLRDALNRLFPKDE